jgi:hypothetical protein
MSVTLWILVLCVWLPAVVARFRRQRERRAVVGSDGVEVVIDGARRFVPFSCVADVDWDECGVLLRLTDGEELALPLVSPEDLRAPDEVDATAALSRRDLLLERCCEGLAAWRTRPDTVEAGGTGSLLDRQGRDPEAWRSKLQALSHDAGGAYRRVALDEATMASVLEDPHASVERRVAAAWTLALRDDPETRQRVRVVVESCASAPAREALSRAAARDLDEATLELMLEANAERAG